MVDCYASTATTDWPHTSPTSVSTSSTSPRSASGDGRDRSGTPRRPKDRTRSLITNRWIIVGVSVQIVGQLALTCTPFMNTMFGTAPIGLGAWGRIVAFAAAITVVVARDKRMRTHRLEPVTPLIAEERT
ncbi:cation transporting ATPase C-terminal domain-containing protein [Rhodococcus sp. MEB041]|uniref:cation transporting ATPase C-terminal domain-containing protein n=1 Tax=Rhodococcus sp. MEB041 TaxID=3040323 RepID=UPI00254D4C86|nr:cation transporting ATPase C-terminal domain-containing protein [Rhodococcus sp. MEB041]